MNSTTAPRDWESEARAWVQEDPDPQTRRELQDLLDRGAAEELAERFRSRLAFGTAGLRGTLGAGPARMNRALVRRVTAGLAAYLLEANPQARSRGVVIARDGRRLSPEFARDTAAVLAGAGIPVHVFADPVPTPVCAFAVTDLGAAAGVMITASHNPPADNGYKVYWSNGAQIIPPHDVGIGRAIDAVGSLASIPLADPGSPAVGALWRPVTADVGERYIRAILGLRRRSAGKDLRIVYTPLHGVGGAFIETAFRRAGYSRLVMVPEQSEPDPDFPTVSFPNPEEPGAMDLALAAARTGNAELVLANDPDADRLAVAVRDADGFYRMLTGNEVGLLLTQELLTVNPPEGDKVVMTTIVSSSLLRRMAGALGAQYAETLTGFKWIANRAMEFEAKGVAFVFGFEEALGYTAGSVVRDKDGVSTAILVADLAAALAVEGKTLLDALESLYRRFGLVVAAQQSLTLPGSEGLAAMRALMGALRREPPPAIAGRTVAAISDLQSRIRREIPGGPERGIELPPSDVLVYELEDGSRILVRPSGTEPKIKFYFEHAEPITADEPFPAARGRAEQGLERLLEGWKAILSTHRTQGEGIEGA